MFARTLKVVGATITIFLGSACNGISDCYCIDEDSFTVVARGIKVVPARADTSGWAYVNLNTATFAYEYFVTAPPSGTIDSIALYQVPADDTLSASATAILCAGAAACASTSGTARVMAPATAATIKTSIRGYGTQLVFFTTTAQKAAGGAMRGTMYPSP